METFEQVSEFIFKCKTCGKEIPAGIFNISGHWAECTAKSFNEALIKKEKKVNK